MGWAHAVVLVLGLLAGTCGIAADYGGVVKTARGDVLVERGGERLALRAGDLVAEGDRVLTGVDGYVGITLADETLLTLGPGALLVVDSCSFDARTQEGNLLITLTRGVLSVVTGLIAKRSPDAFVVKTRLSTMGVRGTEFIVEANEL